jgi:hypothetical protein
MNKAATIFLCLLVTSTAPAHAQQPYAGLERREIKALSAEQIADLQAGRGMGLALAAELNGYPGPLHVLQNADALGLNETQRNQAQALFDAMKAEAIPLGDRLVRQEGDLDRLFASRNITPTSLHAATQEIGETQALLRETHLKYHLATISMLSPAQIERYRELRGYAGQGSDKHHHPQSH